MCVRVEVRNRFDDYLGDLPDECVLIGEYEASPLRLMLHSDQPAERFTLQVGQECLKREGNTFYFRSEQGRRGDIAIRIYYHDEHLTTGYLRTTAHYPTEAQHRYLIRELKSYLISIASANHTNVDGKYLKAELQFINVYNWRLEQIKEFLEHFKISLAAIEQTPQRTIIKHYYVEAEEKARKIDARTLRWRAIHGAKRYGQALTYTNIESLDVYENQFIVHLLKRLQLYLASLSESFAHAVEQKVEELERRLVDCQSYGEIQGEGRKAKKQRREFKDKQIKHIKRVKERIKQIKQEKLPDYCSECDRLSQQIKQLLRSPFLSRVRYDSMFSLKPSLVLLRHPAYHAVYKRYQSLQNALQLDEQQRIEELLERVPIERTSKLYEYWLFVQVYEELKRMGFQDAEGSNGFRQLLDKNTFRLKEGAILTLIGDPNLYSDQGKTVEARLYYNRRFGPTNNFRPDILVEFTLDTTKILVLDAKYRDYDAQGDLQYKKDVEETAYKKYKLLQRKEKNSWVDVEGVEQIRHQIAASFIVHSHSDPNDEARFRDYGSAGHANEYGAIPLVPDERLFNPTNLKRLLKMFMRMHLRLFDICWLETEAHQQPVKAKPVRELGGRYRKSWECEYHCSECNNRWWVNHCGNCGKEKHINVPKITFSDPSDNFFDFDDKLMMGDKRLLKCSTCNQAFLKRW